MKLRTLRLSLVTLIFFSAACMAAPARDMYIATVSDTEHFPWVQGLIESILRFNYTRVEKIAVFDLGLTPEEIATLQQMPYVEVFPISDVNSDMRTKFVVRPNGRLARGWYSWKPVVLREALTMFPYVLYLDAGIEVTGSLKPIFEEIQKTGYYLYETPHTLLPVVTDHVKALFALEEEENSWILEQNCLAANIQGLSQSMMESYVMPVYELAADITNFEDDGSAPWGYGFARHDQALFGIIARQLNLELHPLYAVPEKIRVNQEKVYFGALKYFKMRKHRERDPVRLKHAAMHKLVG